MDGESLGKKKHRLEGGEKQVEVKNIVFRQTDKINIKSKIDFKSRQRRTRTVQLCNARYVYAICLRQICVRGAMQLCL